MRKSYSKEGMKSVLNGNLFKDAAKAAKENHASGIIATTSNIYAKQGLSGFTKGTGISLAQAPIRSTLPYFAFVFGKQKWNEYLETSKERADDLCVEKSAPRTPTLSSLFTSAKQKLNDHLSSKQSRKKEEQKPVISPKV